jgi:hypothetical protein
MNDEFYYTKYLKYKAKYLNLIKQTGGEPTGGKPTCTKTVDESYGRKLTVCCKTNAEQHCRTVNSANVVEDTTNYNILQQELNKKFPQP